MSACASAVGTEEAAAEGAAVAPDSRWKERATSAFERKRLPPGEKK